MHIFHSHVSLLKQKMLLLQLYLPIQPKGTILGMHALLYAFLIILDVWDIAVPWKQTINHNMSYQWACYPFNLSSYTLLNMISGVTLSGHKKGIFLYGRLHMHAHTLNFLMLFKKHQKLINIKIHSNQEVSEKIIILGRGIKNKTSKPNPVN